MKKSVRIILLVAVCLLTVFIGLITYYFSLTWNVKLSSEKLVNLNRTISFYDCNGNLIDEESGGISVTNGDKIPDHVNNAFIAIEDKRFYKHSGVDIKGLFRAGFNNLKSFSFKEGASTITQQLIKNTHLSNEKTIKRKLSEIKLAKALEKKYTKQDILEMYLNTIYFGDGCYGITSAAKYYFDKEVQELSLNDAAILAAIIKAPSYYSPIHDKDKCFERKNLVLEKMCEQGYINKEELNLNIKKPIETYVKNKEINVKDYLYLAKKNFDSVIGVAPYSFQNLKVYTNFDNNIQEKVVSSFSDFNEDCDKSVIIIDKNGRIQAYYSTCGDVYRQMGSVIKPILVYAPAIENNAIYSCTPILDEKTDFNGYCPSNYGDKYLGYISAKEALACSSNVCAVKVLNYLGVEKSLSYVRKTGISFSKNDNSLCLALGASEKGAKLSQIVGAYTVYNNNGYFINPNCIEKIIDDNGKVVYSNQYLKEKVFEESTCSIINDMTEFTVSNGTAKKLSFIDVPVCAKTGTVGNKDGNTDAYCISYNSDFVVGVWFGGRDNMLLDNSITGGSSPTILSSQIWKEIYTDRVLPDSINNHRFVKELAIDKISYDEEHKVILADEIAPERYVFYSLFKENNALLEKSTRFSLPKIDNVEISINKKGIKISLCLTEYYNAEVFRVENGKKTKVYDTNGNVKTEFIDGTILSGAEYCYSVVPYFIGENKIYKGVEVYSDKIKTPNLEFGEDWWKDDF